MRYKFDGLIGGGRGAYRWGGGGYSRGGEGGGLYSEVYGKPSKINHRNFSFMPFQITQILATR